MAEQIEDRVESTSHRKPRETWDQAIRRLAVEAEQHGVAILHHTSPTGCTRYYATSQSEPGALHYVTLASCDCRGFAAHQRCRHQAALLAHLGMLDDQPEPPAPVVAEDVVTDAPCVNCFGDGWLPRGLSSEECARCHGTGRVVIHWGSAPATEINYPLPPAA